MTNKSKDLNKSVKIALLVAISVVLMYFEISIIPMFEWLKLDLSEVPVLIGGFAYGPVASAFIVILKVFLKLFLKGTMTAGVGELANILIGIALVVPASWIYNKNKSKKSAIIGMITGSIIMQIVGIISNIFILLPAFGISVNTIQYIVVGLIPFNGIKALLTCVFVYVLYKRLSKPLFKLDSKLDSNKKIA